MADKKEKKQTYTTPRGVLVYPRLTTPDTKFKDCGEYSTKLRMSREDADKLIAQLQPLYDEAIKTAKVEYKAIPAVNPKNKKKKPEFSENPLFEEVLDDENNETGDVAFKFAMNASGTSKKTGKDWERSPVLFDAKGKPLTGTAASRSVDRHRREGLLHGRPVLHGCDRRGRPQAVPRSGSDHRPTHWRRT
jgi:hypothetical protein